MDETTKAIVEKITVRGPGGAVDYDCMRLSPNDLARMAAEATGDLPEGTFDLVVGIAYRGILFAAAVAGGHQVAILEHTGAMCGPVLAGRKVVVVDDIVADGKRLRAAEEAVRTAGGTVVGCACIVDRSDGSVGSAARPLWSAFQSKEL